ncbi:MAG: hypothetical protein A6D91_07980 [Bacillaceae bacterium G1]|nr:cell division protein ZapA [Bacillota bacterium]OJF17624.1 MAG: hypothetical protein A6D91_07980 [Bacillaceae bacterium G1]
MADGEKNRVTVDIYGKTYTIRGDAPTEWITQVAAYVDQKMRDIAGRHLYLDTAKIAVLAALNLADEYFRLKQEHETLLQMLDEEGK